MAATRARQGGGAQRRAGERAGERRRATSTAPRQGPTATPTPDEAPFGTSDLCDAACVDLPTAERARAAMRPWPVISATADMFKVLGDPTRLRIAYALSREELCVCDLAAVLGVSQSVVSHSLRALRHMRLVRYRKAGKVAYYSLADDHVAHLIDEAVRHAEERAPGAAAGR